MSIIFGFVIIVIAINMTIMLVKLFNWQMALTIAWYDKHFTPQGFIRWLVIMFQILLWSFIIMSFFI